MKKINIHCQTCQRVHEVTRDIDAPKNAVSMWCNWCPDCEDQAQNYYQEGYNEDDCEDRAKTPEPDSPNQLLLPLIIHEIEAKTVKEPLKT